MCVKERNRGECAVGVLLKRGVVVTNERLHASEHRSGVKEGDSCDGPKPAHAHRTSFVPI